MPEGVEVRLTAEKLLKLLLNAKLISLTILSGRYKRHSPPEGFDEFQKKLPVTIVDIKSKGKFLYFHLCDSNTKSIYLGNTFGMDGGWTTTQDKHCHIELEYLPKNKLTTPFTTKNTQKIWYKDLRNFGRIFFMTCKELSAKLNTLGPDMIDTALGKKKSITYEAWKKIIQKHHKKQLVKVLMDQHIISGIGNYLKSEILYKAKLKPFRTIGDLSEEELKTLFKSIKSIMKKAYKENGSIHYNKKIPFILEDAKIGYQFLVYNRKEDDNGHKVKKIKLSDNRTTHWVPEIQK